MQGPAVQMMSRLGPCTGASPRPHAGEFLSFWCSTNQYAAPSTTKNIFICRRVTQRHADQLFRLHFRSSFCPLTQTQGISNRPRICGFAGAATYFPSRGWLSYPTARWNRVDVQGPHLWRRPTRNRCLCITTQKWFEQLRKHSCSLMPQFS